jgi:hypothetical protein
VGVVFLGQATWLWKQKEYDKKFFDCNQTLEIPSLGFA